MAFLLLSLAALNLPQTTVLCIGQDGHLAIEPAAHFHAVDGIHFCGPADAQAAEHAHVDRRHSRSCTDIPIPVGAGDGHITSQKSKSAPVHIALFGLAPLPSYMLNSPGVMAAVPWPLPPAHGTPPRCTILQV